VLISNNWQSFKDWIIISKKEILYLAVIMGIAILFRFWNLDVVGLGGDESVYSGQALLLTGHEELSKYFVLVSRGVSNFLFHQFLQGFVFLTFGFSDFTARFVSAVLSVLTVGLVFLIANQFFGRGVGLLSAFIMAITAYPIATGRVALLDSTFTFMFGLAMLFLAKWVYSAQNKYAYLLAFTTGLAILAKVPSVLIIPITIITLVASRKLRRLARPKVIVISLLLFAIALSPAIYQVLSNFETYKAFSAEGNSRATNVPDTYYLSKLMQYSSIFFVTLSGIGIIVSIYHRKEGDIQCLVWLALVAIFFQITPIKGWNYILPLFPALVILSARGIVALTSPLRQQLSEFKRTRKIKLGYSSLKAPIGIIAVALLLLSTYSSIYNSLYHITYERPFAGLKQAAFWLKENVPSGKGIMTNSHGSAQYLFGLYANIDAYPFGYFKLHTLLPNGTTVAGPPNPDLLVQNGLVKYFVFYLSEGDQGDDPFHQFNKTATERNFLQFIQRYDGHTRHVINDTFTGLNGEKIDHSRVWIFEVGKLLPIPQIYVVANGNDIKISGEGYLINSIVDIYYDQTLVHSEPTDSNGKFSADIDIPENSQCGGMLVVEDTEENSRTAIIQC